MNRHEAMRFLVSHQPLPADLELTGAVLSEYDDVRRFFLENPDEESIPLFLNSFGGDDGCGVYALVEDVICRHEKDAVLPHLICALRSKHRNVRYWCAQIAASFPCPELIGPLVKLLNERDDFDMRYAAVTAIEQIQDVGAAEALRKAFEGEVNEEIRELIRGALTSI